MYELPPTIDSIVSFSVSLRLCPFNYGKCSRSHCGYIKLENTRGGPLFSRPSPDAQVEFTAQIWKTDLEWRKDLTPESAQAEIQKKIAHYKSIPHELIDGTQFIDTFSLSGGGGVVQHWARAYDDNVSLMECYFVSQDNKKRVYYYAYEVGKSSFAAGRKDVEEMAKTFYARDDWDPLPTEPGYAFPGGFSKHSGEWRAERAILAFNSPSYPGIAGYFACYSFGKNREKCSTRKTLMSALRPSPLK